MQFCSKYGYDYGFQGSDEEDMNEDLNEKEQKKVRKTDSNIIAVKFDELTISNETFAGETKHCSQCLAILNKHSLSNITTESVTNILIWKCEFCDHINKLASTNINEIPKQEDVTYLIEPAPPTNEPLLANTKDIKSTDDNFLTYCIDISGSMDNQISSNNEQYMTRLDCVKIACLENLNILKDSEPNKNCSLVTFSDSIKYYGDGSKSSYQEPLINTSTHYSHQQQEDDLLTNKEKMLALGTNQPNDLNGISKSFDNLKSIIEDLRTEGYTALGPGLVFSIGHSSKKEGSQIILCTDGAANVGMGSIDDYYYGNNNNDSEKFYDDLADYAKSKSIQINIVTMQDTDCKLAFLGRLADKTNGTMNIVNPANLSDQFKSILENRIVATNVKATLILNEKYLYIRDKELEIEEGKLIHEFGTRQAGLDRIEKLKKSKITKDIGNATMDTDITFEYGIRRQDANNKETFHLSELPFQLQIEYTFNGAKFIRVYTKKQAFTKDREEALNNIVENEIIFAHNMQMMSEQAMSNNIGFAQYRSTALSKMVDSRGMVKPEAMNQQQQMQNDLLMRNANMSDYNDTEAEVMLKCKKVARKNLF
jgi:hypothetical protein